MPSDEFYKEAERKIVENLQYLDINEMSSTSDLSQKIDYKFDEGKYLKELTEYVNATYSGHYAKNKIQSTEVIVDRGHGTGFLMGNVDKYSNRYGRKGTRDDARKDLMKILHYALIQLYVHDKAL